MSVLAVMAALVVAPSPASANVIVWTHAPMEGALSYYTGQTLQAGFHFHLTNPAPEQTTFEFDNTALLLPYSCTSNNGPYSGFLEIPLGDVGIYTVPGGDTSWYPDDLSNLQTTYVVTAADNTCGGTMYGTNQGNPAIGQISNPTFTADIIQDSPTTPLYDVTMQWHYREGTSGSASWSDTRVWGVDQGPGNLVPEVPLAVLLPLGGLAIMTGVVLVAYRRSRRSQRGLIAG